MLGLCFVLGQPLFPFSQSVLLRLFSINEINQDYLFLSSLADSRVFLQTWKDIPSANEKSFQLEGLDSLPGMSTGKNNLLELGSII